MDTKTVEEVIASFNLPESEQIVLRAAVAYYEKTHPSQTVIFNFDYKEFGGNTDSNNPSIITIQVPGFSFPTSSLGMHTLSKEALFSLDCNVSTHS
ncbi:MAG: hypothetical protein JXQ67_03375 [Campylobacterales bacterium]|nr:hypothetical protein [Campylobacterales bacterium]